MYQLNRNTIKKGFLDYYEEFYTIPGKSQRCWTDNLREIIGMRIAQARVVNALWER